MTRIPHLRKMRAWGGDMNAIFEGIGASVRRKEDLRFISGHGHYVDDMNRPGQLHAVFRRSDRPHAKITACNAASARRA